MRVHPSALEQARILVTKLMKGPQGSAMFQRQIEGSSLRAKKGAKPIAQTREGAVVLTDGTVRPVDQKDPMAAFTPSDAVQRVKGLSWKPTILQFKPQGPQAELAVDPINPNSIQVDTPGNKVQNTYERTSQNFSHLQGNIQETMKREIDQFLAAAPSTLPNGVHPTQGRTLQVGQGTGGERQLLTKTPRNINFSSGTSVVNSYEDMVAKLFDEDK